MSDKEQTKDYLKSFEFHGITFKKHGNQAVADCPLCNKEAHFFVNPKTGQWDCKVCGESGNLYSFLTKFHESIRETYKKKQGAGISALSKLRKGIPNSAFKDYNITFDGHRYYLPVMNGDGHLANLKVWDGPGTPMMGTAGCVHHLLNASLIQSHPKATLYLCEGEWDCIALDWLKDKAKKPAVVLGLPGATVFKDDWSDWFVDRDIVLLLDNDTAGQKAQDKLINRLQPSAKSLRFIQWPSSTPDGYDINDFVAERVSTPGDAWKELHSMLVAPKPFTEEAKLKLGNVSFERILREYRKFFYVDNRMRDSLAVCLAVAISIQLPHDPLWLFLVAPPSSGKTIMLSSFRHSDRCEYLSSMSSKSLVSGWKTEDGSDPSLLARLGQRTLVLKDYTEIMSMPAGAQEEIYGVLRNAFDGEYAKTFGHGENRLYKNCFFSMLAGVTHAIKGDNRAALGERFLRFGLLDNTHNAKAHIKRALDSFLDASIFSSREPTAKPAKIKIKKSVQIKKDKTIKKPTLVSDELKIQQLTTAFVDQTIKTRPSISQAFRDKLEILSDLVASLRTRIEKTFNKDPKYRPEREIGARLVRQLAKLAQSLCVVLNKRSMDEEIYRIVKICALDTVAGYHLDAIRPFVVEYPSRFFADDIALETNMSSSHARACLIDLLQLNLLDRQRVSTTKKGQPAFSYGLLPEVHDTWKVSGLDKTLKEYASSNRVATKRNLVCKTLKKNSKPSSSVKKKPKRLVKN